MILDNEDLMPGEDVYFWEEGKDNFDFGTIKSDEHAYCLIDHILDRHAVLPARVHKSRISRDMMQIVKLIANSPQDTPHAVEQNKPQQQMLLFG